MEVIGSYKKVYIQPSKRQQRYHAVDKWNCCFATVTHSQRNL